MNDKMPNKETIKALNEYKKMKNSNKYKRYGNFDEIIEEIK